MTPDEIVAHVVANAKLERHAVSKETIAVVRRIANKEMTPDEIQAWQRTRVAEILAEKRRRRDVR